MIQDALEHLAKMRPESWFWLEKEQQDSISSDDCDAIAAELGWEIEVRKVNTTDGEHWYSPEFYKNHEWQRRNPLEPTQLKAKQAGLEAIIYEEFPKEKP